MGEVAFLKAEGVSEKVDAEADEDKTAEAYEDKTQTQITLISPTKQPDMNEELNGMEEKDEEEHEFWNNEEEAQRRHNETTTRDIEETRDEEDDEEEEHGLSQEVTEEIDEAGEEGREAEGIRSPMRVTKDQR